MEEISIRISRTEDIFSEARKYLTFLSASFVTAVANLNERNRSFQITDDLSIGDIYSEADINSPYLKSIEQAQLTEFVDNLLSIHESSDSIHEFIEQTHIECSWDCPQFEYDSEGNIVDEIDNPTFKLFVSFSDLYIDRITSLVDELIENNFEQYWDLLFELKSFKEIENFLEARETQMNEQRRLCSYYYDLINRVRSNFCDVNIASSWPEEMWSGDYWQTISSGGMIQTYFATETNTPLRGYLKILQGKISKFYLKFTLRESREPFINGLKKISKDNDEKDLLLFVQNNFHFSDSIYTTKIEEHDLPKIRASSFAVFLRIYFETQKILGATKRDLILWMAYEFYGQRGFKYGSVKGYLERESLSRKHKEAGNSIVKSFQRKLVSGS